MHAGMLREYLPKGLKLACGALAAILLANLLGLRYSATAGIITLLSILGTKRETLTVAAGRLLAYGVALVIAAGCYGLMGYTAGAFAVFLFLFAVVCCCAGWMYALSPVAVLASHFMAEGTMAPAMLLNETLLLVIGAACGIAINMTLRADDKRMRELLRQVDASMRALLAVAAEPSCQAEARTQLHHLDTALGEARMLAAANRDNRLGNSPLFDTEYVAMRTRQRDVLIQIMTAMEKLSYRPAQQEAVADFFRRVAAEYHMDNDVSALQEGLRTLLEQMKTAALPATREEFESRAVLYYALVRLGDFLDVKGSFYREHMGG